MNDKSTRWFARPPKENIRQGEGRHVLRFPTRKLQGLGWRRWSTKGVVVALRLLGSSRISILFRKSLRQDRSHKLWGEANKKAQCGKSVRWV